MADREGVAIDVRYFGLSEPLQPYFTALYLFTITCPPGELVEDMLHPEWTSLRFSVSGPPPVACIGAGELAPRWPFVVSGPTSQAIRFGLQQSQIWGLGIQPAGMARYLRFRASEMADTIMNGSVHPAFVGFAPLLEVVRDTASGVAATAARIERFLLARGLPQVKQEAQIIACQDALRDEDLGSVNAFADRVGMGLRSLERLCCSYFGFGPKMLLRRQRFLRSLAQFTMTGSQSWSRALDGQYYDQPHFVRDFKAFMGTTPTQYAAEPHPILDRILIQRIADQGALPEANPPRTDLPTMLRYGKID